MIRIDNMSATDIPFAVSMTDRERWGYLSADFNRLLYLSPHGCFIGRDNDVPVGVITSVRYGAFAFLGTLIVSPDYRNRQIGETLMRHAIAALHENGVTTIELDGVFPAAPLYRRLGFRDKYLSLRFLRPADDHSHASPPPPRQLDALMSFDVMQTGLDRQELLTCYAEDFGAGLILAGSPEKPQGYAFAKPRDEGRVAIGPLIAIDDNAADEMLTQIISFHGASTLWLGVPEVNSRASALARRHGFLYQAPSLRMYLGEAIAYEHNMYGIVAPEKG